MTKLYPFQKAGVLQLIKFKGRALLADEMGLGKTIQALTYTTHFSSLSSLCQVCLEV